MDLNEFKQKYPNIKYAVFAHNIISNACSKHEGKIEINDILENKPHFRGQIIGKIGRKGFLKLLKHRAESHIEAFWKRKLSIDIDKDHWTSAMQATNTVARASLESIK